MAGDEAQFCLEINKNWNGFWSVFSPVALCQQHGLPGFRYDNYSRSLFFPHASSSVVLAISSDNAPNRPDPG